MSPAGHVRHSGENDEDGDGDDDENDEDGNGDDDI